MGIAGPEGVAAEFEAGGEDGVGMGCRFAAAVCGCDGAGGGGSGGGRGSGAGCDTLLGGNALTAAAMADEAMLE